VDILRGETIKQEKRREIQVKRNFLTRSYLIHLDKKLCVGCGICAEICPKEAIDERPHSVVGGRLRKKPTIDFDIDSCILCGECAVLCPLNALRMEVDGKEVSIIVKNEAFPVLVKEITVMREECKPECELRCQEECPTEAIKVLTESSEDGKILRITDVEINEPLCLYCKRCESACPLDAIRVKKPFQGTIELNADLCPEGCRACIDLCPAHAIELGEDGKPTVLPNFCLFCSACQKVCPKEAIKVKREWIFHTDIRAAAWLTALKKLTSVITVAKEIQIKSAERRFSVAWNRLKRTIEKLLAK
jgi:4Fe-4S ferredoxin